jgi:dTDP-4-dehydrorhamnose 3,5-epimerase
MTGGIDGVQVRPLRQIVDDRGRIMHMLRRDDPAFSGFGEIYFSVVNPQFVKGWHRHSIMTLNYAVVTGTIVLVLYDDREGSRTRGAIQEIPQGGDHYVLATVPPGVWNGFKGLGDVPAIVANCATHPHDPQEIERLDPFTNHIPYSWGTVLGGG